SPPSTPRQSNACAASSAGTFRAVAESYTPRTTRRASRRRFRAASTSGSRSDRGAALRDLPRPAARRAAQFRRADGGAFLRDRGEPLPSWDRSGPQAPPHRGTRRAVGGGAARVHARPRPRVRRRPRRRDARADDARRNAPRGYRGGESVSTLAGNGVAPGADLTGFGATIRPSSGIARGFGPVAGAGHAG